MDASDRYGGRDVTLRDPFLDYCKTKKRRRVSRDSFVEGESSQRPATESLRHKGTPAGSCHALYDPFEEYVKLAESNPSSSATGAYKRRRASRGSAPQVNLPEVKLPDIVLKTQEVNDPTSDPSGNTSDISDTQSHSSDKSHAASIQPIPSFEILSLSIDEMIEIPDFDLGLGSCPNLKIDDGEQLYSGASISTEQAIYTLVSWFSSYPGVSKSAFNRLLHILHTFILPAENNLPPSYESVLKKMQPFLSPIKDYHSCINDCIIFRDSGATEYAKLSECPKCGEDRYEQGTKIPRKRFKYFPLENRVRRLFSHPKTSQLLQNHSLLDSSFSSSNVVTDIQQSETWKSWYSPTGIFAGESRSLSFAVCLDGLNPFSREKNSYSVCPMFLMNLNLPPHIRKLAMLTGLIPGPREPKHIDPYVDVLVDDIMHLNTLKVHDAYKNETFLLKADIVLNIFDYPGQNKVLHCQGAGAYAGCAYRCIKGQHSKELQKMVYLDHRSFLPRIDCLRTDNKGFPTNKVADKPPQAKTMKYVDDQISELNEALSAQQRKKKIQESGCTGDYSLRRLPNHDRYLSTPVEPMHVIKNIAERIVKLLSGVTDTVKVRLDEQKRKRFQSSWIQKPSKEGAALIIPPSPFSISKSNLVIANTRSLKVKTPSGIDWKPCKLFGKDATHLKSNQWKHVIASGILKFCIRGLLGKAQESTLMELCDVMSILCAEEVNIQNMDAVEYRVHRVLSQMERDFPATIHVITLHLLHHLPMYMRRFGPLYSFWMYPLERFNNWIKNRVLNRRFPEATVMESYRLYEIGIHLELSEQLPFGAVVDVSSSSTTDTQDELQDHYDLQGTCAPIIGCTSDLKGTEVDDLRELYKETYDSSVLETLNSATIVKYRSYVFRDNKNRLTKFGTQEAEHVNSIHESSYVHLKTRSTTSTFGRIQFIFTHVFMNKTHTLALVHWFEDSVVDTTSGLSHVNVKTTNNSIRAIVYLSQLSKPLIHATDESSDDKLWILNHVQK